MKNQCYSTERERTDYYERRWLAEQVVKGKIMCSDIKREELNTEFPRIFMRGLSLNLGLIKKSNPINPILLD